MRRPQLVTAHDVPEERWGVDAAHVAIAFVVAGAFFAVMPFSYATTAAIVAALVASLVAAIGTLREAVLVEEHDWPPTEGLLVDLGVLIVAVAVVLVAAIS